MRIDILGQQAKGIALFEQLAGLIKPPQRCQGIDVPEDADDAVSGRSSSTRCASELGPVDKGDSQTGADVIQHWSLRRPVAI